MIWNEKILFLHFPKTAGMSITEMLHKHLHGNIFSTSPEFDGVKRDNIHYLQGRRHETLCDAASYLSYRNMTIDRFERIFCVIRNPYDLELSRYSYLQKNLPQDRGLAQKIAMKGDFTEYLRTAPFFGMFPPKLHLYITFNRVIPDNLIILRYETLAEDINTYMRKYLKGGGDLPFLNESKRPRNYISEYNKEREQLCFERHRFFFEKGFYSREIF